MNYKTIQPNTKDRVFYGEDEVLHYVKGVVERTGHTIEVLKRNRKTNTYHPYKSVCKDMLHTI